MTFQLLVGIPTGRNERLIALHAKHQINIEKQSAFISFRRNSNLKLKSRFSVIDEETIIQIIAPDYSSAKYAII